MSAIAENENDLKLGDTVTFTVVLDGRDARYDCVGHGRCARVKVAAYQDGELVYAETGSVGQARGDGTDPLGYTGFVLGGGWSLWKERGGPATCTAELYRFEVVKGQQTWISIAIDTFEAAG